MSFQYGSEVQNIEERMNTKPRR